MAAQVSFHKILFDLEGISSQYFHMGYTQQEVFHKRINKKYD